MAAARWVNLLLFLGTWGLMSGADLPKTRITLPPWNPQRLSQRGPPPPIKSTKASPPPPAAKKEPPIIKQQWLMPPVNKLQNKTKSMQDEDQSASFFFANVGPHGFEYRAVFHHGQPNPFNLRQYFGPMVEKFQWPDFNEIFGKRNKLVAGPPVVLQPELTPLIPPPPPPPPPIIPIVTPRPEPLPPPPPPSPPPVQMRNDIFRRKDSPPEEEIIFSPPKYDMFRGAGGEKEYPKIFRFNGERVNIVEFERGKKMGKERFRNKNDPLDPGKVDRSQFLVLHGGVYDPVGSNELAPDTRDPVAKLRAFFYSHQ